ncbi:hypothetical protein EfmAA242_09910 [Enterococcus faecium]|nr:hypothetical protein EfmAA242_09910 [Enterococcus faecium]
MLYQTSKLTTVDFANKYLFDPIGIPNHVNYYAETAEEHKQFTVHTFVLILLGILSTKPTIENHDTNQIYGV